MKKYSITDMKDGYFVGDFMPTAFRCKGVEISFKKMDKYMLNSGFYRKIDSDILYIVSGRVEVDREEYGAGEILVFEPTEVVNLFALENTQLISIKIPGTPKDAHRYNWKSYEEIKSFFGYYFDRIKQLESCEEEKMSGTICQKDITVVVQGYVDQNITKHTVASIRKCLPGARVILSTWEECDCTNMDYDKLVLNKDPGACDCSRWEDMKIMNNGNRQIVSTQGGLQCVETKYCLKLRSDLLLLDNGFLGYFQAYDKQQNEYAIFSQRLIIGELFTRNNFVYPKCENEYSVPQPFHPSDWFVFGLTEDVRRLYSNISLIPPEEMKDYVCKYHERVLSNNYKYSWRYATEQHIFFSCVKEKFPKLQFEDWTDWNEENIEFSKNVIFNNFVILNLFQHKIVNMKYIGEGLANSGMSYKEHDLLTNRDFKRYLEENI